MFKNISLFLALALSLVLISCGAKNTLDDQAGAATQEQENTIDYATMPANTSITVTLTDSIDTDVQVTGESFQATLTHPIVVNGQTLFAGGANARGTLDKVVESGRLKTPAELHFTLTGIQDSDGRWIHVGTNTIIEKKASHTNREVAMIGGGAIVGGIIGKIVDRKGSTEIGAVAGAAAGTGLAAATGKRDIFHGVGTEITFYSSHSLEIALQ